MLNILSKLDRRNSGRALFVELVFSLVDVARYMPLVYKANKT